MAECMCTCTGHVCDCRHENCEQCGCGPDNGIQLNAARVDRCRIHSINFPYGQTCPLCAKNE